MGVTKDVEVEGDGEEEKKGERYLDRDENGGENIRDRG